MRVPGVSINHIWLEDNAFEFDSSDFELETHCNKLIKELITDDLYIAVSVVNVDVKYLFVRGAFFAIVLIHFTHEIR